MNEELKIIEQLMNEAYLIVDPGIIRLLCATVIANRLPLDPVWLFIVAPSGGGKTEMIAALNNVTGIYPLSSLTSSTFVSGMKKTGKPTSLLMKVREGILTFKDFTSVLTIQQEERKEIMGQLREIYDGSYVKEFGTGDRVEWKGKIGLLAGVTTAIHTSRELYASMGERFIMYDLQLPDRLSLTRWAMNNTDKIRELRIKIKDAFKSYLDDRMGVPGRLPIISEGFKDELQILAEFSTRARSPVERDWRSMNKEIVFVHTPESPTRFATQLMSLARAFLIMNDYVELLPVDKHTIYKIALDSITATKRKVLQELAQYNYVTTPGVAVKLNYPTLTVKRWLEDLNALEMVDRIKGGNADKWHIKEQYRSVVERYEGIKLVNMDLDESTAENLLTLQRLPKEEQDEPAADDMMRDLFHEHDPDV